MDQIDTELIEQFEQMYLHRFGQEISSKEAIKQLRQIALIFEAAILECKAMKHGK